MAFETVDTAEIQVKKPVTRSLMEKIKNSLDFLNGKIGSLELQGIQNGSFEIDSDFDGIPDNWTWAAYPGGTATIDSSVAAHGAKSFKITHPGGSGNGGGVLTSDYMPCSAFHRQLLDWVHYVTASQRKLVQVAFYTKAKIYISTVTLYDNTAAVPSAPAYFVAGFMPPATACYMKFIITGGHTAATTAGSSWFDGLRLNPSIWYNSFPQTGFTFAQAGHPNLGWVDAGLVTIPVPALSAPAVLSFQAEVYTLGKVRFRIGSDYSNEFENTVYGTWLAGDITLPFNAGTSGNVDLVMQISSTSGGNTMYGRKLNSAATIIITL